MKVDEASASGADPGVSSPRIEFIDSARGLTILLMIFANTVAPFLVVPAWSKHAEGLGFTYVDAIAPTFMFILGLSMDISFARRRKEGAVSTLRHFLRRFGLLFLFGSIGTALIYVLEGGAIEWIIFQNIAIAGLLILPFLFIRRLWIRTALALALMLAYGAAEAWILGPWLDSGAVDAGLASSVARLLAQSAALATLALFGAGVSGRVRQGGALSTSLPWGLAMVGAGLALWRIMPPYRGLANLTYLLLGLGWGNLTVAAFYCLHTLGIGEIPALSALGKNSLLLFMVASLLYKTLYLFVPEDSSPLSVGIGAIAVEALCIALAELLKRRRVFVKL